MGIRKKKTADMNYGDTPNVVNLNLPRDHSNDGAAWVYLPSKDTIYIGPPGSYHVDIANSLKTLVDKKKGEKPITGVQYDDGYVDYFDAMDQKTTDRILKALQTYHDEHSRSFNRAEDDAGAWDTSNMLYPRDEDYEEPDERSRGGLDYHDPEEDYYGDDDKGQGHSINDYWDAQAWGTGGYGKSPKDEYKELKPTPGQPKPIGEWDVQDYLDWRDKKYWNAGGYFATPREDYPHFRWSYGDSRIWKGCPHEGLWVWPTHNGYPDHFSQTGHNGLGNCAQGRIYPHQGDRWEILTWPGRPRNAPDATKQYLQEEAQQAVKQYVMEKIGVPEDKIFFTNMHYSAAVSMYNSPSYPDEDYSTPSTKYVSKPYHYDYEPLENWNAIPEGTWNILKDPEGRTWQRSSLPADKPGDIRLFNQENDPTHINVDPSTASVEGWEIGKKVYDDEYEDVTDYGSNENPYDWKPGDQDVINPNESIKEFYDRIKAEKDKQQEPQGDGTNQIGPPAGMLKNPDDYHRNPDGTYSRLTYIQKGENAGNVMLTWNGTKWSWQKLTPEETYATKVRWFEEDEARRRDIARKMWPEAFSDTGDEFDENGELIPPQQSKWHTQEGKINFSSPEGDLITVTPEDYELAYRLHGDNWYKSFLPNRNLSSVNDKDLWVEAV